MSTHVLEAVIVACVMLSAMAYVSTFTPPHSSVDHSMDFVKSHIDDLLRVTADMPPRMHCPAIHNMMEQLVVDGASHNETQWKGFAHEYFPPGIDANMWLNDLRGRGEILLHGHGDIGDEAKTWSLMPDFTASAVTPREAVTGTEDLVMLTPVEHHAELVRERGDALRTTITLGLPTGTTTTTVWSPFALLSNSTDQGRMGIGGIAWNISGHRVDHRAIDARDLGNPIPASIEIHGVGDGTLASSPTIPAGSTLIVHLPSGWSHSVEKPTNWDLSVTGTSNVGFTLTYVASTDIRVRDTIVLKDLTLPLAPRHPFDVITARSTLGSFSQANLVVAYAGAWSSGLPLEAYPTTPYLLRPNASAYFGVGFANGGDPVNVERVDFEVPGGYDVWANHGKGAALFEYPRDDAPPVDLNPPQNTTGGDAGYWHVDGPTRISWNAYPGGYLVGTAQAASFGANFTITRANDQSTSVEPASSLGVIANVTLPNGYHEASSVWGKSPGIIEVRVPPESSLGARDGYDIAGLNGNPGDVTNTNISTKVASNVAMLVSKGKYATGASADLLHMDNAIENSTFQVVKRNVPAGGLLQATGDVQSVVDRLATLGVTKSTTTIDLYGPPNVGCASAQEWSFDTSSLPHPAVTSMTLASVNPTGGASLLVGDVTRHAYRFDADPLTGKAAQAWNTPLSGAPTSFALWVSGSTRDVLVGDDHGFVTRLDGATASVVWSSCVDVDGCPSSDPRPHAVRSIATNGASGVIAVGSERGGVVTMNAATGSALHHAGWDSPYAKVEFSIDDGGAHVLAVNGSTAFERYEPSLDVASMRSVEGSWISFTQRPSASIRLVGSGESRIVDSVTLALLPGGEPYAPAPFALAAATGTLGGDIITAVARDDYSVVIYDESTGGRNEFRSAVLGKGVPGTGVVHGPLHEVACPPGTDGGPPPECLQDPTTATEASSPLLRVDASGILYVYSFNGVQRYEILAASGARLADAAIVPDHSALLLAGGSWGAATGVPMTFLAYDDGTIEARDPSALATPIFSFSASANVGKFSFATPLPRVSFYGTHLLVVTIEWTDSGGRTQDARSMDWFTLTDATGEPVTSPGYGLTITTRDLAHR